MARPVKKTVYDRIDEKKNEIKKTETLLSKLNMELNELYSEKDKLEMELLLSKMKENKLDIKQALNLLQNK